ncbi:MAG TPA: hypothetical protein ENN85_09290 [Methanoculleus sp.]|nr:hypothetical protein [Methanoculleus sp.]
MDEASKQEFKVKFAILTVLLDVVILLIAFAVIAFFLLGPELNLIVSALLAILAIILGAYFWRVYRRDKAWLEARKEKRETE